MTKYSIAVLASGRGSNLQSIIDSIQTGKLNVDLKIVISDKSDAYALTRAFEAGFQTEFFPADKGESRESYGKRLADLLTMHKVDLVVLAGFMRIISKSLIERFPNRIINIHPSLLPAFPGLHAQRQAVEAKAKISGCTVHFVDEGCDTGPIILQKEVIVDPSDTEDSLSAKILKEEHQLLPKVIDLLARNKVQISNRLVTILD